MTGKIFLKLIGAVLCLLALALVAVDFLASRVAESNYIETRTRELAAQARLAAMLSGGDVAPLAQEDVHKLSSTTGARITVVAPGGTVLLDSEADPEEMENHGSRPEVIQALATGQGSSIRLSPTVGAKFLYVAVAVPSGAVRLAVPLAEVEAHVDKIRKRMLASTALAFLPAFALAAFFARRVSARLGRIIEHASELANGNFRSRLPTGDDELGTLSRQLNETGEKLEKVVEELRHEHTELERLERIRKDFVINVSHELRTPLASIQGYTETLLDGAIHDTDNNIRFLSIIHQNAERLGRLTADLLTLSRLELKTQDFRFASYRVNTLLADSVDSMRPIAAKKRIHVDLEPLPDTAEVFCDSEAVHQILVNLLDNAVKYTPEGGTIHVGGCLTGDEMAEIFVKDEGPGVAAEEIPRLFERFYRVDKARSRELGGTGLGLAIVKHLVRAQGGEVRVESEPNKGSIFSFTLRVQDLDPAGKGTVHTELTPT